MKKFTLAAASVLFVLASNSAFAIGTGGKMVPPSFIGTGGKMVPPSIIGTGGKMVPPSIIGTGGKMVPPSQL
jgi:hypothetical protein